MADFKLPVAPIFDGESFELDGDVIKGKGGGGAEPDNETIELNADGKLQIKDEAVSLEKMATVDTTHAGEFYKVGDDGRPTFGSVEPDNTTIEFNASDKLQVKNRGIALENLKNYPAYTGATLMLDGSGNPKYDYPEAVFEYHNTRECGEFIIPEMSEADLDSIILELQEGKRVLLKYYIDGDTNKAVAVAITSANLNPSGYELGNSGLTSTLNGKTVEWYYPDEDGLVGVKAAGGGGGGATPVSVESSDRAYIMEKTEVGYKLGDNVYWFNGIYEISGAWSPDVGESNEIVGDFLIDGKRVKATDMIPAPLTAYTSKNFMPCGAGFVNDYRTSNNLLLFTPVEGWVGGMVLISGIIETEES